MGICGKNVANEMPRCRERNEPLSLGGSAAGEIHTPRPSEGKLAMIIIIINQHGRCRRPLLLLLSPPSSMLLREYITGR